MEIRRGLIHVSQGIMNQKLSFALVLSAFSISFIKQKQAIRIWSNLSELSNYLQVIEDIFTYFCI